MIPVGPALDYPLESLMPQIPIRYPWLKVEKIDSTVNSSESYDSHRNQYHSTRMLAILEKKIESLRVGKLLGVTEFDLYVPGMNFVFGEARCPGRVGVISTHRLEPPSPGMFELYEERVVKEAVHEIGHMLGLRHCSDALCVMHFSEKLLDTDRKQAELCRNCQSKLRMPEV